MSKVAVIAGSSGMTGTELLHQLCASKAYTGIILLVRRPSGFLHAKVKEYIVDFEALGKAADHIRGDVLFCCLGTNRKQTRNTGQYYHIDHDYTLHLASIALANGIREFHLLSAINAHARSRNFYLKIKGATENDVAALPFRALHIYRPFVLSGSRETPRLSEKAALAFLAIARPLLRGSLRKYRSIEVSDLARVMIKQSLSASEGIHYYSTGDMLRIARSA